MRQRAQPVGRLRAGAPAPRRARRCCVRACQPPLPDPLSQPAPPAQSSAPLAPQWRARVRALIPEPLGRYWPVLRRLGVTVSMLAVIRLGSFIAMPGVDMQLLPAAGGGFTEGERMVRALYAQAGELPAALFDLGISPHLNASILVALLFAMPKTLLPFRWADRLREARKEGKGGEAFINRHINYLALLFALYMSCLRAHELAPFAVASRWFVAATMSALMGGAFMIHHCANTITAHGLGNGTTLVICTGIVTEYASALHKVLGGLEASVLVPLQLAVMAVGYLGLLLATVYLATSEVRLPIVQYSTAPTSRGTGAGAGGRQSMVAAARQLLDRKAIEAGRQAATFPILLNSSGVMPMIIASAAWYGLLPKALEVVGLWPALDCLMAVQASPAGLLVYGLLVFGMEFLPLGAVNPEEVSEYFGMINVGVKGVPPGAETVRHLRTKVMHAKFWGGLALATLAVTAHLFDSLVASWLGTSLATTSLIIIVGAVLQTARQLESVLQGPTLQRQLERERSVIQSLAYL